MPLITDYLNVGALNLQLYGITIMIIIYVLSLLGCILIAIIVLKIIISCFIGDRLFCNKVINKNIDHNNVNTRSDITCDNNNYESKTSKNIPIRQNSYSTLQSMGQQIGQQLGQQKIMQTVTTLENILLQLSQSEVSVRDTRQVCTCPKCADKHRIPYHCLPTNNCNVIDNANPLNVLNIAGNSSDALNQVVSRLVLPIVSHRQSSGACDVKTDAAEEMRRFTSYGDVLLELKQKFASNSCARNSCS